MDKAILARRITWLSLRAAQRPGPCMLCHGRLATKQADESACERCGRPIHFMACWLAAVATPNEQRLFLEGADLEAAGFIVLCPGCRS
jgi:hypothetical protein